MANPINRRDFLHHSAVSAAAAGLTAIGTARSSAAPANEQFAVAVMGVRNRGKRLARLFAQQPDVTVAYICDADENMIGPCIDEVAKHQKQRPQAIADFRHALDDKSIDGIVVATPDHWHAPATIHACLADKHVYVEKPCSHNLLEGRRMVEVARKTNRVVQVGTQRRTSEPLAAMVEFIKGGGIGKVSMARTWTVSVRENIGFAKSEPVPSGVHYDLWLGPAAERPFTRNHFHYRWHWFWDYGTGEIGNNGIHALDVARWALDIDYPVSVVSTGGKHFFDDEQETPDTQIVCYEYPELTLVQEHRTWMKHPVEGSTFGVAFYGAKGTVTTDGNGWQVHETDGPKDSGRTRLAGLESAHQRNWLECIKSGARPNADIEVGHVSTALCHLGNISQRVGRKLVFHGESERFNDRDANDLLGRQYRKGWELPSIG